MRHAAWRLLREAPADGASNMARDEALLDSAGRGAPPTLRLYSWLRPTLSLGAHQPAEDADLRACRLHGIDLVRRPTGGGAVLHETEVTYSVAGRLGEDPFPSSVIAVYERIASALVAGLSLLAVPAELGRTTSARKSPAHCFARPSSREILIGGRKIVGSAQVRRRRAFLQHGSILIAFDPERVRAVLRAGLGDPPGSGGGTPGDARRSSSEEEPTPATLREWTGRDLPMDEVERAIVGGFERALGVTCAPAALDAGEAEEAARLRAFKYLDASWTLEGKTRQAGP